MAGRGSEGVVDGRGRGRLSSDGGNSQGYLYKIITLMLSSKATLALLALIVLLGAQSCPPLCTTNCSAANCPSCRSSFTLDASITNASGCACPPSTFLSNASLCLPCPVTCLACSSYSRCSACLPGFIVSNRYTCIPAALGVTGWASKNVSYELSGSSLAASDLQVASGNSSVTLTQATNLSTSCSKLAGYSWLGGYGVFSFNSKLTKSIFALPQHQWLHVRFQAVLIDKWLGNTLLLELNNESASPQILWQGSFTYTLRFADFCGNSSIPDNLAVADAYTAHSLSSAVLTIRLNESEVTNTTTSSFANLPYLSFAIRELFIRVGSCPKNCKFCSGPAQCNQCILPYTLTNGSCICNSSFGFLTASGCQANCPSGFYFRNSSTNSSCVSCEALLDNCQTCNASLCSTCALGYFLFKGTTLSCRRYCPANFTETRNYFDNSTGSSIVRDQCTPCPANCMTCNGDICLFCTQGFLYFQGVCVASCPQNTTAYLGLCSRCPLNCLSCSNPASCNSCSQGYSLSSSGCVPLCFNTTTLASSNQTCGVNCASGCLTCFGPNVTQCLSCSTGYLQGGSCLIVCSSGYYPSSAQCLRCPEECAACSSAQSCLQCSTGFYLSLSNGITTCVRMCPSAFFPSLQNSNTNSSQCVACSVGCERCKSSSFCLECQQDYYRFNFSCTLTLSPSYYYSWEFGHFKPCPQNCLKCRGVVCSICASGFFLNQGQCVTDCGPNKYKLIKSLGSDPDQYGFCEWKSPKCEYYNGTYGNCNQCSSFKPSLVSFWANNITNCLPSCPEFYTQSASLTCVPCPANCRRCTASLDCLECLYNYVINAAELTAADGSNQSCVPNYCQPPFFSDSVQCQKCNEGCQVCQMDGKCLYCLSPYQLNFETGICYASNCSITQYSSLSSCLSCPSPCRTCLSASLCTSCIQNSTSKAYLLKSSCVSACPSGYFPHQESTSCRKCNPKCTTCSAFQSCITCAPQFSLLSFYDEDHPRCVAECPLGFYSDTQVCQRCFRDCQSCYGPSEFQCLTCYPNFALEEGKCVWECSDGKYQDKEGVCEWCDSSCNECKGPTFQNCVSCGLTYYIMDHVCYPGSCPDATYLAHPQQRVCEACQFGCANCRSPQFCKFCFPGYSLYRGWCYLKCPGSLSSVTHLFSYLGGTLGYICQDCLLQYSSRCVRCNRSACTKCASGYYLYKNSLQIINGTLSQKCLSVCPVGTYVKSREVAECVACQSNCLNCTSFQNCINCAFPFNLVNGYCSLSCPAGYYLTLFMNCSLCPSACLSCFSSGTSVTCVSCANGYLYYNTSSGLRSCLTSCPTAYFADQSSGWCSRCLSSCSACTGTTNCTQCLSNFTLSNGLCLNQTSNCSSTCQSCSGQNCMKCVQPYLLYVNRTTSSSSCVSTCPQGYYSSIFTCELCNSSCAACANSPNNCSVCQSGLFLYGSSCIPVCPLGFYASSALQACQICPTNCLNCQASTCYACRSGFFLSSGQCLAVCPSSSYGSVSTGICYDCPTGCSICTGDESCTVCLTGYLLFNGSCSQNCPMTAYSSTDAQGSPICLPCPSPCYTCQDEATCISCLPNYILNGSICQSACSQGSYSLTTSIDYDDQDQNYDFSNFTQCFPCDSSCSVCSGSSTTCQACNSPYVLSGSQCLPACPAATYLADSNNCLSCPTFCVACANAYYCSVCANNTVLYSGQCLQSCPARFYLSSQGNSSQNQFACLPCSITCQSCTGPSSYQCLTCNSSLYLTASGDCVISCPVGTYVANQEQSCAPCPYGCSTCLSLSNCSSCIASFTLSSTNQCRPNTTNCTVANCLFCSPNTTASCAQCTSAYYLYNSLCVATCPTATYAQNRQCSGCPTNCLTCSASVCLSCSNSSFLYLGACIANCPAGTYTSSGACQSDTCLVYNSTTSDCLQCASPYLLLNQNQSVNGSSLYVVVCTLNCPSGTVQSGTACIACSANCLACLSAAVCTSCLPGAFLFQSNCLYTCPVGTYPLNATCRPCSLAFCSECAVVGGVQTCTSCLDSSGAYLVNGNCVLLCPTGTYADTTSQSCKSCSQSCVSCSAAQTCTACNASSYLYIGQCISACPAGTFAYGSSCLACSTGCVQCSSSACSACQASYSLLNGQCVSACPSGYYPQAVLSATYSNSNQFTCNPCISPCLACSSASSCTQCASNTSLYGSTCVGSCPSGYYSVNSQSVVVNSVTYTTSVCMSCSPSCLTCLGTAAYCLSCPSGFLLDTSNNCVSNCVSPTSYYSQTTRTCSNCSSQCYSCYGAGTDNCLSCRPPLQLYLGTCFSSCPFGYYPTPVYLCQKCSSNCASCVGTSTNCTLCTSGLYLQSSNGSSTCSAACLSGYYANATTQACTPCSAACLTCTSSSQCSSCANGLYLVSQTCVSACPSGTTLVSAYNLQSCSSCPANCLVCTYLSSLQALSCTQCSSNYYLVNGNCSQTCPSGTYASPTAFSCADCGITGCQSCSLNSSLLVSCSACQASFYLYNGQCFTACPSGTVLSGSQCTPQPVCQGYQWNGFCLNSCPPGTYPLSNSSSSTMTCSNCSALCSTCTSSTSCQSCLNNTFLYSASSTNSTQSSCVTVCPSGFYTINGVCQVCTSPCLACQSGVNCLSCISGFYQLGTSCLSACPTGYYAVGSQCLACSSICASCSGSAIACTLCKNTNANPPNCLSVSNCTSGQYQSSNTTCSNCDTSCLTCFGSSNYECLSCSNSTVLISGTCSPTCPAGTVKNGSSCLTCPQNCLNCSVSSGLVMCSACASGFLQATANGSSVCVQSCASLGSSTQSYIQINGQCQFCSISGCILCSYVNNQTQCSACSNSSYLYNQQCVSVCPSATMPASSTCSPCSSNCQQCNAGGCTVCGNGTYLLNGGCVSSCGSGYYASNSTCYKCSAANCINCSASACLSCQAPYLLGQSGSCSSCVGGYFMSSGICQVCSSQCLACVGASSNCTICAGDLLLFNSSTCVSWCPTGYYQTAGSCSACTITNCLTCTNNICTSCTSGFVLVSQGNQTSCQSSCPASMYVSSSYTCINCSSSCLNCSTSTSCNVCSSPSVLYQGYCISSCPSGNYAANQTCVTCPSGCKTCSSAIACTSCNTGLTINANGSCSVPPSNCSAGYYLNSLNSCSQCFSTCNTCVSGSASGCSSCFSGYTLSNGVCVQNCDTNSFYNANATCQLCSTLFANCLACTSSGCLSCSANYTTSNGSCTQSCPSATFLANGNCASCPQYCLTCTSSTNCSACLNASILLFKGLCYISCPDQTYLSNNTCAACYQTCLTCSGNSTNCLSCITPYSLNGRSCVAVCPDNTYASNYVCYNCSSNCLLCTGSSSCTKCASGYYLLNGTCRTVCPSGYYIDSNRCLQCVYPCLVCSSRTACSSCQSPSVLQNGICINTNCTGGYYDYSTNTCVNCTVNHCAYCSNTTCSYCASGYYSIYLSGTLTYCAQGCLSSMYPDNATMNCSSCFSNCFSCLNSTWCNICNSPYYLLSVSGALANECVTVCPLGYHQNTTIYQCQPCGSNCNYCLNATSCQACVSNYYLLPTSGNTCVSNCPTMYYTPTTIDGTGICGQCGSYCYACVDALTCTQCISSTYVVLNGQCTPYNCVRCLTCNTTINICINCSPGYYLYNSGCLATCPDTYYPDNSTGQCLSCVSNCIICKAANSCLLCISGYVFVNGTGCQNAGLIEFGVLGNMSGFTSNITRIMAIVYVSTSSGPIAFGAIGSTYGPMQSCQFMYLLQGSTGGNQEVNNFLNGLSAVSYTTNSGTNDQSNASTSSSQARRLTAINYTATFLETNMPIFLIMLGFICAYIAVLIVDRYKDYWFSSCPNFREYLGYMNEFMKKRFKYIYVDCVMWISYLPFMYFAILQLKANSYASGMEVFSSLLAIVIVVVYPLYPFFILRLLFDCSNNLTNYESITLRLPEREDDERSMCQDVSCCPRIDLEEMSLSPYVDKVVRPVFNRDIPEYSQFRYFKIEHWKLAYAAIKYIRKLIYVLIVALCPDPVTTLSLLVAITVAYMSYLIILKPKQKLYLVLELLLESVLLFFIVFMLIYVTKGGAAVSSLSIVTHAIGFIIANSALAIAIILNLMSYYTIFCCIVDMIKYMKGQAVEMEEKMKQFDEIVDDKQKVDYKDKDKEDMEIRKSLRRGDDEMTVENNEEEQQYVPYDFDEKEFNVASNLIKKKTFEDEEPEDFSNLKSTKNPKARHNRKDRKKQRNLQQESHTSEEIMGQSKVSDQQDIEGGLLKDRNSKFKREVNKNDVNVDRGELRQPTDNFRRNRHQKDAVPQQQQSIEALRVDRKGKQPLNEFVADIDTHDRIMPNKKAQYLMDPAFAERQARRREKRNDGNGDIEEPYTRQREGNNKNSRPNDLNEVNLYERQKKQAKPTSNQKEVQSGNLVEREKERRKNNDPFGLDNIVDPASGDTYNRDPKRNNPPKGRSPTDGTTYSRDKNQNDLSQANTYERKADNRSKRGHKQEELQSGNVVDQGRKKENPFGEFEEIFAHEDNRTIEQAQMEQRKKKDKSRKLKDQQQLSGFPVEDANTVQRKNQPKKYQNLHYKGSDEEQIGVAEGQLVEVKNKFKRNARQQEKTVAEGDINAVGRDIKTKKVEKLQSLKQFAEDEMEEAKYKERQGKDIHKVKSYNEKGEQIIEQATGFSREKRLAQKKKKDQEQKSQGNYLSPSPTKPKSKPNFYGDVGDITESIEFKEQRKVERKPKAPKDEDFQQQNMGKNIKTKPERTQKIQDNRMQMDENIEESYDDVVKRNKQQMFKQNISTNKSNLLDLGGEDQFEEVTYSRPQSKMERPRSRNKDLGLGVNPKDSDASDNESREIRKQRNSAIQRIRKKGGTLTVNDNEEKEEGEVGGDSRRVSRIIKQKSRVKGVLNIEDKSENEDIEQVNL